MSRVSEFQTEYGLIGAGALSKSLIAALPRKSTQVGPVVGVSLRVASRMTNSLRAGRAARNADELNDVRVILFHAPDDQVDIVAALLEHARIDWADKPIVFCDCRVPSTGAEKLRSRGASIAVIRQFGIAGTAVVEGAPTALVHAHRIATQLRLRAIEITEGSGDTFAAALTLATAALTPLANRAASLLRASGLRDKDAVQTVAALFEQTIQQFEHSGKQSWAWHARRPDEEQMAAEIAAVDEPFRDLFRQLILAGFDDFDKHPEVAKSLREISSPPESSRHDPLQQCSEDAFPESD